MLRRLTLLYILIAHVPYHYRAALKLPYLKICITHPDKNTNKLVLEQKGIAHRPHPDWIPFRT